MLKKMINMSLKSKFVLGIGTALVLAGTVTGVALCTAGCSKQPVSNSVNAELLAVGWPSCFAVEQYVEPEFVDDAERINHAFNVADFGEQGNNGWFYRYGSPMEPSRSKQVETKDNERYFQIGAEGFEIKKDFIHTATGVAPILEWRAAKQGEVNVNVTYVKNVNNDKNPSFPDGVCIHIFKGDELLQTHEVEIRTDAETLLETTIENLALLEDESVYFVVDPKENNAYDGGSLYVAITDVAEKAQTVPKDTTRKDNNANNIKDFGEQGKNGWRYMCGKDTQSCELVSDKTEEGYMNNTSPTLAISKEFIHPSLNDDAILSWTPKNSGNIEIRGTYTKFEENDGNPNWPDGVTVRVYLNQKLLFEKAVAAPKEGTTTIEFREERLKVTPEDNLYFTVSANKNASYDGGCFSISILDRNGMTDENSVKVDESETRQNFASVKDDFGKQGNNGWFFQEGYKDQPFGAYNMTGYVEGDKYVDDSYLEIKRDFVNTGENGKSAVIKWKVAQNGKIRIDAAYTKLKNEDKNPSWPDGTRVTLYHNNKKLVQREFAADVAKEVTKELDVNSLTVKKGDYITLVVNGKENNAYDGGKYEFSIIGLSDLVGETEDDVEIEGDKDRTNNASVTTDFGKQGNNGWFFQYGYKNDPFFAVNVENYQEGEKYITKDGIEIKKDFIMPSTKGKSANVKWVVAKNGTVDVYASYTKLKNEDKNPSWPDGTTVTLMHNNKVLGKKTFAPDTKKEVTKEWSVSDLKVKKGDCLTLIVDGKDNTAYDGGLYAFAIEDATDVEFEKKNDSDTNRANLESDFGEQGSNGWYYLEGTTPKDSEILTKKTADGTAYVSSKGGNLEIKKDFVQPRTMSAAMYQWVVAVDGEVDVLGNYVKFGHNDGNPSWPDGTILRVYKNNTVLLEKEVSVYQGDGNNNTVEINLAKQKVKKGDIFTFAVAAKENDAWDGGRLSIQVKPCEEEESEFKPAPDNEANLFLDFGEQGSLGWYYGYGNSPAEFAFADMNNGEYSFVLQEGLLLKKDGVHPGSSAGAIYRWVAGEDGKIDLEGAYYKSRNENPDDNAPDGVVVKVYKNGKLVKGMSYEVPVSKTVENIQLIECADLEVKRGDQIDFIVLPGANNAWDYGKLEVNITKDGAQPEEPEEPEEPDNRENDTDLFESFGEQGNDGWYYLEGNTPEDAKKLTRKTDDGQGYLSLVASGLEVKKDFVQPGVMKSAMYQWVVAKDGKVDVTGSYMKFGHNDGNPSWPDGTKLSIYLNNTLLLEKDVAVYQGDGNNNTVPFKFKKQDVSKGDKITFVISAKENNAWDGGKLSVLIKPASDGIDFDPAPDNNACLFDDFGAQGNEGWYFGCGNTPSEFVFADKSGEEYRNAMFDGLLLKKDGVHPANDAGAIYRWVVGEDGKINLDGKYFKSRNENAEDNAPDGVCVSVYKNGTLIDGMRYDVAVSKTEEVVQEITYEDLSVEEGDFIDFVITAKENTAWDYGKLEMTIATKEEVASRTNNTNLFNSFGEQGNDGWYYGVCAWNGENFVPLVYDPIEHRYFNEGKPELKADFVEPGQGLNAAYKWVVAEDGRIKITGNYTKFANADDPNANGVCMRIFHNGVEKRWIGGPIQGGNIVNEVSVDIYEEFDVRRGDEILFAIDPDGNDSYDGGRLAIQINEME